jgi:hypothetical protein
MLRAQDPAGASRAWEALHGAPLDLDHPAAQVLVARARTDPSVTAATIAETMPAIRLLDGFKRTRNKMIDRPFDTAEILLAGIEAVAEPPLLVAVGRSEIVGEPDPLVPGGALPWNGGRLVGWADHDLAALGASLDANPPARLVTIAARDATGSLYLYAEHTEAGWVVHTASEQAAGIHVMVASEILHDHGREAMVAREGTGLLQR